MRIFAAIFTLVCCCLVGCNKHWEDGPYTLMIAPDDPEKLSLVIAMPDGGWHSRVEYVQRIGSNSKYIVAQSRDRMFWVVDKTIDSPLLNADQITTGPLSAEEFKRLEDEKGLDSINLKGV